MGDVGFLIEWIYSKRPEFVLWAFFFGFMSEFG